MCHEDRRAARRRLARPGRDERAISATAARRREGSAAEEQQAERCVRGIPGRDGLAVDEPEEHGAVDALPCVVGLHLLELDLFGPVVAERLVLDSPRRHELVDRYDPAGGCPRRLGHLAARGEHHPDRHRLVLVRDDAERAQPLDEVGRRARLAELPLCAAPAAGTEERADLLDCGLNPVPLGPYALHGGGMQSCSGAEVDRKPPVRVGDELAAGREGLVDVRVLGELSDHCHAALRPARVDSRCSGSTLTSARTGMKLVSPLQRGTMCWCRWAAIEPPATAPRFQPTLKPSGA
jgi:hypothetical protein